MSPRLASVLAAVALVLAPTISRADGVADEADLQFELGADAYRRGDARSALEYFLASNRLVRNRNVMFNIARAYEQLGRYSEAYRYYVDALGDEADAKVRTDVEAAIARIAPRVAVVDVTSDPPGATVYLERKDLGSVGTTPSRLGLPAGTYRLIVERAGHEPRTLGPVGVRVGSRTALATDLPLIVGFVEVEGPEGVEVRLDDERGPVQCLIPCRLSAPPGLHQLNFRRDGFRASPRSLTVTARETTRIAAEVVAETGSIVVETDEPGAAIEVDGERVGFSPFVATGVPIGPRRVRITRRGYAPIEREVVVSATRRVVLDGLSLEPVREVAAASRDVQRLEDAPASVTVIDGQELAAFAYPTILEALRGVRGFAINYDSFYGNAAVRGLGQANDYNNRLLVLSDGAVLNENVLYQPFIHYDGRTDLGDVERIEIVRGPASVLYGTGAVSGVVNLVLRDRDVPPGLRIAASTYDGSTARVRIDGAVGDRDAGGWASLALARSEGRAVALSFVDDDDDPGPHVAHDFDRFRSWTATGKAWWRGLTAQGFFTSRRLVVPTGSFGTLFDDPRNQARDERLLIEVKHASKPSATSELALRGYLNWAYYGDDLYFAFDEPSPVDQSYREEYRSRWLGAEARWSWSRTDRLKLTLGAEATVHPQVSMVAFETQLDGSIESPFEIDAPYQVLAASALVDWRPAERLAVQLGARFDYWNLTGNQLAEPGEDSVVTSFPALSPKLAVIARPSDRDVVKVMAGSAFRAPSAFELYYQDGEVSIAASNVCGEILAPETVYSAELEGSRRFGRDWVGLAALHTTYARNIVESVAVPVEDRCGNGDGHIDPEVVYYRNSPVGQLVLGADVELRREWRLGTMLSAQYGLLRARYTQDPGEGMTDRRLPNAPTHVASFKGVIPIVPQLVTGAVRVSFEDRRRIDPSVSTRSERAVIADLVISGTARASGLRYAVGVYNLFDWQYALPATPYASSTMPQAGRSFIMSIGYTP